MTRMHGRPGATHRDSEGVLKLLASDSSMLLQDALTQVLQQREEEGAPCALLEGAPYRLGAAR